MPMNFDVENTRRQLIAKTRFKAREAVQKMCLEALIELDSATSVPNGDRQ